MDAKLLKLGALCALSLLPGSLTFGATQATTNFVVTASSDEIARKVADCAEFWRKDLALQWLGKPLPNWYKPCPISVKVGQIGAGGQTTFTFENGEVFGWKMSVQGTLERILDSVIPHEVNHTIFASHFRRPLPRWADEGAATLFEHESEQARQTRLLDQVLHTNRRIPLKQLLAIREYPEDMQDVLTLYAEGYSLAGFLVGIKGDQGRVTYLKFLGDQQHLGWPAAIQKHYGFRSLEELESRWNGWIVAGSPAFAPSTAAALAHAEAAPTQDAPSADAEGYVIRSQSPQEAAAQTAAAPNSSMPPISRQLRASRTSGEADSAVLPSASNNVQTAAVDAEQFRSREDAQPLSLPSPPPATLSPTAAGISIRPEAKHYEFPEARR